MSQVFDLANFDSYKEDNRREVKSAKGGLPNSLWNSYSAMANTYGGVIICGVKESDSGRWFTTGLKDVEKLKKTLFDQANDKKRVSINLLTDDAVQAYEINGDVILVINVPKADRETKPVYLNNDLFNGTYKRAHEGDYRCTPDEVRAMIRDQAVVSPDMKVLERLSIDDFNTDSIRLYRLRYEALHPTAAWAKLPDAELLVKIGAASDDTSDHSIKPNAAGLLMFGQEYRITREFPRYFLDYKEINPAFSRWADRIQSQSGDFSGNVFDFFSLVYPKLTADFKKPFMTEGAYRIEETPKHLAVREALVNCLVNADYFGRWNVIIEKRPDQIVMANPGSIIPGKKQMLRGGISEPRNRNLFKMFNLIGIGEHAGSGVPDIFEVWRTEGLPEPTVIEDMGADTPPRTTLVLPLLAEEPDISSKSQEKSHEKSQDADKGDPEGKNDAKRTKAEEIMQRTDSVLSLLRSNSSLTTPAIAKALTLTDRQVRTIFDHLKQSGIVHFEGSGRGGHWVIDRE